MSNLSIFAEHAQRHAATMGVGASAAAGQSYALLKRQDAEASNAIIAAFGEDGTFAAVAAAEASSIATRDAEDGEKLAQGIALSVERGALEAHASPPQYTEIDVLGKTPDDVARAILDKSGVGGGVGGVVAICGLSGTGKGTTVAKLHGMLPGSVGWSNGNIFRSLTLLASTWCEQNGAEFGEAMLTPERIGELMDMLSFDCWPGEDGGEGVWDTRICGMGLDCKVADVQNTELKGPKVKGRIPTVANFSQGEVVKFASAAVNKMGGQGLVVLLEGRQQTVDYIDTPHRFTLTMSDPLLIGRRRAAQRVGAMALQRLDAAAADAADGDREAPEDAAVARAMTDALGAIAAETS